MAKFLLVIAVFIVIYLLLRKANTQGTQGSSPASKHKESKFGASKLGEDMVRCGVCGVHLPTSEAVASRGDYFCSKEHLQLAVRERDNR